METSKIIKYVCDFYGVTVDDLKSLSRKERFIVPRQIYCYLAYKLTGETKGKIGSIIERDRTTVIHSIGMVEKQLDVYRTLKDDINELSQRIKGSGLIIENVDLLAMSVNYTKSKDVFAY